MIKSVFPASRADEAAKQRLQEYAEAELLARGARKASDAQDRILQRQEAALEKYHRRRTGEKEDAQSDEPKEKEEQRRLAIQRRKQRQAAAERNEAALEKHRARQQAIREGKAVTRISTAPEARENTRSNHRGAPRVANLDGSNQKSEKRWVTVAESTTPSPVGRADFNREAERDSEPETVLSARAQKYSHEDRRALIDRLEVAEQTVVHLNQRVHDLETRQVVKPAEVADDDALESALARALAAEVALENARAELSSVKQDKEALEKRLEAAAANVAAADEALFLAQQSAAAEEGDTVQCGSPGRHSHTPPPATDVDEEEDNFEDDDDFEDEDDGPDSALRGEETTMDLSTTDQR